MPDDLQHINHSQHNITFLEGFYSSYKFNDWAVTVSFYTAVHIIEAVIFIARNVNINGKSYQIKHSEQCLRIPDIIAAGGLNYHEARNIIIGQNFSSIAGWFKTLYNESRTARYRNYSFANWKIDLLIKSCLKEIIKWYNKKYPKTIHISI